MGRLMRALAAVAVCGSVCAGQAARWFVRVAVDGGIAGAHKEVSINADGRLLVSGSGPSGTVRCEADVSKPRAQEIAAAIARSHPETWLPSYVSKQNPLGCCDQMQFTVHVDREDDRGGRTSRETYWFTESAPRVPEAVSALFTLVYETRHACVF